MTSIETLAVPFTALAGDGLQRIGRAAWQGALFILAVYLVCRLWPLPPARRALLWWMASFKLILTFAVGVPVSLAVLPAPAPAASPAARAGIGLVPAVPSAAPAPDPAAAPAVSPHPASPIGWRAALAASWLAGVLAAAVAAAADLARLRRLLRRAEPVKDPGVLAALAALVSEVGLPRPPDLRWSDDVTAPQVSGLVRPVVLLPLAWRSGLPRPDLRLALAHELHHLRRNDLWLGLVPALSRRLFFFHPLARLAEREYALAREAACDAAVVGPGGGAMAHAYARLLLRFGVVPPVKAGAGAVGAAASPGQLKRRLEMLAQLAGCRTSIARWSMPLVLVAVAGLVPVKVVAVAVDDTEDVAEEARALPARRPAPLTPRPVIAPVTPRPGAAPLPGRAPSAPAPAPAGAPALAVAPYTVAPGAVSPVAAAPPALASAPDAYAPEPPVAAVPAVPALPEVSADGAFVLLHGSLITMNGSMADVRAARRQQRKPSESLLWFRQGGRDYVIRDRLLIAEAGAALLAQSDLGQQDIDREVEKQMRLMKEAQLAIEQNFAEVQAQTLARQAEAEAKRASAGEDRDQAVARRLEQQLREEQRDQLARELERIARDQSRLAAERGKREGEPDGAGRERAAAPGERHLRELLERAVAHGQAESARR